MTAVDCEISRKDDSIGIPSGFMDLRAGSLPSLHINCRHCRPNCKSKPQIVDDTGKECAVDTEGQVALKVKPVRPIGLFQGYLRKGPSGPELDVEKNEIVFVGDFYLTGDQGYKDASGHIFLVGRADDVISSSGWVLSKC